MKHIFPPHFQEPLVLLTLLCISGEQKSEEDDTYKIFNEFKEVINTLNGTAQQENGEGKKSQWFIVSLMRLVQKTN